MPCTQTDAAHSSQGHTKCAPDKAKSLRCWTHEDNDCAHTQRTAPQAPKTRQVTQSPPAWCTPHHSLYATASQSQPVAQECTAQSSSAVYHSLRTSLQKPQT